MAKWLIVLCERRHLQTIVEEFTDWKEETLTVLLYGLTTKATDGFILVQWSKPLSEGFFTNLRIDEDILDFFTYDPSVPVPVTLSPA